MTLIARMMRMTKQRGGPKFCGAQAPKAFGVVACSLGTTLQWFARKTSAVNHRRPSGRILEKLFGKLPKATTG
jgi:hypothetical protein